VTQEDNAALDKRPPAAAAGTWERGDALRASEQQFQREFGHAPWGMLVTSLGAQPSLYFAVNDAFCQLTGYSRQELSGASFLGDVHPDEQPALDALIQQVISGETEQMQADTRLVRKDGEIVPVHLTGCAIKPAIGERYLTIFAEDTTAAEHTKARISKLEHELARSRRLESTGQLVTGIAHDFNNLLTVIANYASLVRDEISVAEATESTTRWQPVRWDVEQIEEAADRAKMLIKHMLAFARREEEQPVIVDIGQLVGDATLLLGEVLGENVPVVAQPCAGLWPVEVDPGLLEQVITNIAVNARDAMPNGGQITIDAANVDTTSTPSADLAADWREAAVSAELMPGRYVGLRITDTGAGMDAVIAERAFEPFFTTKNGDHAAGLGLTAVRRFAVQAGGKAWLRSEPGAGTTVTIILPAASGSSARTAGAEAAAHGQGTPAGTVLVVDDEPAIRDVVHRVLTSAGYRVVTAADGPEALSLLGDPAMMADLVLTDVVMPRMTSKAFTTKLQTLRPGIPVLFMSGYERPDGATDGWPGAGAHIIGKPFSRAALLARVTQALAAAIEVGASEQARPRVQAEARRARLPDRAGTGPARSCALPAGQLGRQARPRRRLGDVAAYPVRSLTALAESRSSRAVPDARAVHHWLAMSPGTRLSCRVAQRVASWPSQASVAAGSWSSMARRAKRRSPIRWPTPECPAPWVRRRRVRMIPLRAGVVRAAVRSLTRPSGPACAGAARRASGSPGGVGSAANSAAIARRVSNTQAVSAGIARSATASR
jgi:PAS domain S-box-containing protein